MANTEKTVWMTVPEMAEYMRIGKKAAYRMIDVGDLPVYKLSERKTIVKRTDVDKYVNKY